jgi:regulator of protease activity HflC (stomatin/prohibitin superfamily)
MVQEREMNGIAGLAVLGLLILVVAGLIAVVAMVPEPPIIGGAVVGFVLVVFIAKGLFIINPNEGIVLQLFGRYVGTVREAGLKWANPFYFHRRISLRVRNFESAKLKVNDLEGSPIEIAAIVVWRVVETAEAAFEVDDYQNYVHVQTEAALRNLATHHAYDAHDPALLSLRGNTTEIAQQLQKEIQDRLSKAGVEVIEARISHMAYAPEIAAVMLRRQQAGAVVAARTRIVEGAVGMVEMALELLDKKNVIHLDEERKAAMVSNLLVVLCGDREAQPIVNTGTIYQ